MKGEALRARTRCCVLGFALAALACSGSEEGKPAPAGAAPAQESEASGELATPGGAEGAKPGGEAEAAEAAEGAGLVADDAPPDPKTLPPPEIWSEIVSLQNSVHALVEGPQSVGSLEELVEVSSRISELARALPEVLDADETRRIQLRMTVRAFVPYAHALRAAASTRVPGRVPIHMHRLDQWLVTLEEGLPRDQLGSARVRPRQAVDWNKFRGGGGELQLF